MSAAFDAKVAIVTGAAGGINRVILTRLAEDGARCVLVDVNDEWDESVAIALRSRDLTVTYMRTDVRYSDQVDAVVARAVETYGRLDILVHGAGAGVHKEIVGMSDEEWDLQIGSTSGNNAHPRSEAHAASKAGRDPTVASDGSGKG